MGGVGVVLGCFLGPGLTPFDSGGATECAPGRVCEGKADGRLHPPQIGMNTRCHEHLDSDMLSAFTNSKRCDFGANRSNPGARSDPIDGGDRRGVRNVQCGGRSPQARAGGELEQRVVPAVGVRRDQLHAELGVRGVCSARVVDRRVLVDDLATQARAGEGILESAVPGIDRSSRLYSEQICVKIANQVLRNRSAANYKIIVLPIAALSLATSAQATSAGASEPHPTNNQHPVALDPNASSACVKCHSDLQKGQHMHTAMSMGCTTCHTVPNRERSCAGEVHGAGGSNAPQLSRAVYC